MIVHLIGRRFQFDSIVHDCVIAALAAGVGVGRRLKGSSLERLAIGVDIIALRQRVLRAKQTITRLIDNTAIFTHVAMAIIIGNHSGSGANSLGQIFSRERTENCAD